MTTRGDNFKRQNAELLATKEVRKAEMMALTERVNAHLTEAGSTLRFTVIVPAWDYESPHTGLTYWVDSAIDHYRSSEIMYEGKLEAMFRNILQQPITRGDN